MQRAGETIHLIEQLPVGQGAPDRERAHITQYQVSGDIVGKLASRILEHLVKGYLGIGQAVGHSRFIM